MSADLRDADLEERAAAEHAGLRSASADPDDWSGVPTCVRPMVPRFPGQRHRARCGGIIRDGICGECHRPVRRPA